MGDPMTKEPEWFERGLQEILDDHQEMRCRICDRRLKYHTPTEFFACIEEADPLGQLMKVLSYADAE